jgi:streptogramin lyase
MTHEIRVPTASKLEEVQAAVRTDNTTAILRITKCVRVTWQGLTRRPARFGRWVWLAATFMLAEAALSACSATPINYVPSDRVYVTKAQMEAPYALTAGPDGNIWFTEYENNNLSRLTPTAILTNFPIEGNGFPERVTAGPDGALWFTDTVGGRIGRLTTGGRTSFFSMPDPGSNPTGITTGPDGALWCTEHAANKIARITTAGTIVEYELPHGGGPAEIVAGADNALWFTEDLGNRIGRITTFGTISEFDIPTANSHPGGLTRGSDGAIWFSELAASRVGRIGSDGRVVDFPLPVRGVPLGIAAGPDGNIWITLGKEHAFCRSGLTAATQCFRAGPDTFPGFITAGPDSSLWFTEPNGRIGKLTPPVSLSEYALPDSGNTEARLVRQDSKLAPVVPIAPSK